jgi:hypothetical protein
LGGDKRYVRVTSNAAEYWPLGSGFVFSVKAESGFIKSLKKSSTGEDNVLLTDRFFLGQPQIRGFDYRGVGPRIIRRFYGPDDDNNPATPEVAWPDVYKRYATSVRRIDDCVGDVMQLLKDLKIDENTLVIFSSDNGPSIESYLKEPYKPTFFGSYGPFDGIKRDCWEGGMRVPTIAHWPAAIPAGRVSALPSSFADWMPTFANAAGLTAPARTDGVSLLPTLTGQGTQIPPHVYIEYFMGGKTPNFQEFEPGRRNRVRKQMQALRIGDYVGVRYDIKSQSDDFEIYNAVTDPKESHNLAGQTEYAELQKQFKETALQSRRPDPGAKRPYDGELVPSVAQASGEAGVSWKRFDGAFPWTPQFDAVQPTSTGHAGRPGVEGQEAGKEFGLFFTGFIEAPADGAYTFSLTSDGGTLLRLHEATVIDGDFGHKAGKEVSASILLKKGKHPLRLYYTHHAGPAPVLKLEWSGPGIEKQAIGESAFTRGK